MTNGNGNRRCDNLLATLPLFEIAIVLLRLDYVGSVPVLPYPVTHSSPAYAPIGAIILGQESQIDWKAALAFQKEIKHGMHLDYLRTGRGRPHIDW